MSDADTVSLQQLEASDKLRGLPVVYSDPDRNKHDGTILARDRNVEYSIQLEDGTTMTAPSTALALPRKLKNSQVLQDAANAISTAEHQLAKANHPLTPLQRELLRWHRRLRHLPFLQLRLLAKSGILPWRLSEVTDVLLCACCLFGKIRQVNGRLRASQG